MGHFSRILTIVGAVGGFLWGFLGSYIFGTKINQIPNGGEWGGQNRSFLRHFGTKIMVKMQIGGRGV